MHNPYTRLRTMTDWLRVRNEIKRLCNDNNYYNNNKKPDVNENRPTTTARVCVCVWARVYCRRVNTIIGCKLVICERARVHISTKLYHPRHRSTFYIIHYNVYTKAGRCLSSLLYYYYFCIIIIIISFIAPRGTRALPPTHEMETVRQYRTPKSCSVPIHIYIWARTQYYHTSQVTIMLYLVTRLGPTTDCGKVKKPLAPVLQVSTDL